MHDLPNCPIFTRHRSDRKEQGFWLVCPLVSSVRSLGSRLSSDVYKVIALGKLLDFIEPQRPRLQTGTPTGTAPWAHTEAAAGWARYGPRPALPAAGPPGPEGGRPLPGRGGGCQARGPEQQGGWCRQLLKLFVGFVF